MTQADVIQEIRKFYEPMVESAFLVEPFVVSRSDGYSGFYNVIVHSPDALIFLQIDVKPVRK